LRNRTKTGSLLDDTFEGGAMGRLVCIAGVLVLMFWATWAFCQGSRAEEAITARRMRLGKIR